MVKVRAAAEDGQHGLQRLELELSAGVVIVGRSSVHPKQLTEPSRPASEQIEQVSPEILSDQCPPLVQGKGGNQMSDETKEMQFDILQYRNFLVCLKLQKLPDSINKVK